MLLDFHETSNTIELKTNPKFYFIPCRGVISSTSANNTCSKFTLSKYRYLVNPRCYSCVYEDKKYNIKVKRKERDEEKWIEPNSHCNWRYLTNESCTKRRLKNSKDKHMLKIKLANAVDNEEKIILNPTNDVENHIQKFKRCPKKKH